MKASELTKANIGDTIVVRGKVSDIGSSAFPVSILSNECPGRVWLAADTEVEIVERPLKVGDEVLCGDDKCFILALEDNEAWVRLCRDQTRFTVHTSNLKRVAS